MIRTVIVRPIHLQRHLRRMIVIFIVSSSCLFFTQRSHLADGHLAIQEPAKDELSAACDAGLAAYHEHHVDDALALLKTCVQQSGRVMAAWRIPERREAVVTLGLAYLDSGNQYAAWDVFEAIVSAQQAVSPYEIVELPTDNSRAYYGIGAAYYTSYDDPGMKEFSMVAAIESFKKAISLGPNYSDAFRYLGDCYDAQHKYELAIDSYKEAVRIDPANYLAQTGLGSANIYLKQYAEAIDALRLAISGKADFVAAHYYLAEAFLGEGDVPAALEEYRKVKKFAPEMAAELRAYWSDERGAFPI